MALTRPHGVWRHARHAHHVQRRQVARQLLGRVVELAALAVLAAVTQATAIDWAWKVSIDSHKRTSHAARVRPYRAVLRKKVHSFSPGLWGSCCAVGAVYAIGCAGYNHHIITTRPRHQTCSHGPRPSRHGSSPNRPTHNNDRRPLAAFFITVAVAKLDFAMRMTRLSGPCSLTGMRVTRLSAGWP